MAGRSKVMPPHKVDDENASGELGLRLVANMANITWDRIGEESLRNAETNKQYIKDGFSLAALRGKGIGLGGNAIVVAAGPSVERKDPLQSLKKHRYEGALVTSESAIFYCLRNGVIPDLAVTVDPHVSRIVRWLGDPSLSRETLDADDYYRRQDQDEAFADEMRANRDLVALVDEYGPRIKIAVSTSASLKVVERVLDAGMEVYWWNPMMDDPDQPNSITRELMRQNGLPCVNAGGNVGTAAWMMAGEVLGKERVAVTGMDFSYYSGTPYLNTQYYRDAVNLVGEDNLDSFYIRVHNKYLDQWFYTDPAYMWYREAFLEMAADADYKTFNCTEGGILFGDSVEFLPLDEFLRIYSGGGTAAPDSVMGT